MKRWQSRYNPQCKLSQQDLLDISEAITQTYAPHDIHHQPELVLMPVDPINLYAYWNLNNSETDENIINNVDKQLALRICSLPELSEDSSNIKFSFDVRVQGLQNRQKIHLPAAASAYSAVIGEINADNSFSALATSDTIHVPRENPVIVNSLNNHENTVPTSQIKANNVITDLAPFLKPEPEYIINGRDVTVPTRQALENNIVTDAHTENVWYESATLENFKGYGYDLKVYGNEHNTEPENSLLNQTKHIQMRSKISSTIDKNTSGQGRLLECI